jgi:flavin reductase (DIM6/NTAB) family NADH-FMN oxidoreductase RutF
VSILGEKLLDVARFGSAKGQPKFVDEFCSSDPSSDVSATPVVANSIAHVDCLVDQTVLAGDHIVYIGRVSKVVHALEDRPLVYYSRAYHRLGDSTSLGVRPLLDETVDSLLYDYPLPRTFARHDTASRPIRTRPVPSMTPP